MAKITINLDSLKPKREWKRHKVAPGHNVYRILPPFGDASNGYPYRKWMITWGLVDVETGRLRPFASSLTNEKQCPVFEYVEALTKKAEDIKASMKTEGASDVEIKERLKELNKVISNVRPKTVYAYNAINKSGEVGILEIKATAQKQLKELMMGYIKDYNQDPTSLNSADDDSGIWFDFERTGTGFDTEYSVSKVQNKIKLQNGKSAFEDDRSALPENVVQDYESLAYDLSTIYQTKSYDELRSVLLANIREIIKTVPDAEVEGFNDFSGVASVALSSGSDGGDDGDNETPVAETRKPAPTSKVNLKLGSVDEDEVPVTGGNGKSKVAPSNGSDDIFAIANSFLNQ